MYHTKEIMTDGKEHNHLATNQPIIDQFRKFILENNHPCIMAQSVCTMENINFHVYDELGTRNTARQLLKDLSVYLSSYDFQSKNFFSFIAVFNEEKQFTEEEFENALWFQLRYLHQLDDIPWDKSVSDNPEDDDFSFSLLGKAFYIVGMHPHSSRKARQSPLPALVFNLHEQFEKLREMGVYHKVRDRIRKRDLELQGSINPMLKDFGEESEAKQYSGRKVGKEWKCPFHQ
ncbi:MAG TPA: guanitoxin biosynthesis heme-dependent pre-guanitoxin N-hydroxylase GntA [Flavobacteriaceae bacterium]|nr:guanitoxin biosynthesis heme-dependent pre-guanitoxin N-hydroxylase GntA [Flavobacteriaceae bacterium]